MAAITTSNIDPQYKTMLQQVLQQDHIDPNSAEGQKILAMGMVEGDLGPDAQDKSKSGGSANLTGFNLNQGMVDDLRANNMLPAGFNEQDLTSGNYQTQMAAAVKIMDAYYQKDGTGAELEHWVRSGSATASEGFSQYDSALTDTEAAIKGDTNVWTDGNRFSEDVSHQ